MQTLETVEQTTDRSLRRISGPPLPGLVLVSSGSSAWTRTLPLLRGESGAGKEVAAQAFHVEGPRPAGPSILANCAAVPEGVAERLLSGARQGACSGAVTDTKGYVRPEIQVQDDEG